MEGIGGKGGQRTLGELDLRTKHRCYTLANVQMPFPGACIRPMAALSDVQHSSDLSEADNAQILRGRLSLDLGRMVVGCGG